MCLVVTGRPRRCSPRRPVTSPQVDATRPPSEVWSSIEILLNLVNLAGEIKTEVTTVEVKSVVLSTSDALVAAAAANNAPETAPDTPATAPAAAPAAAPEPLDSQLNPQSETMVLPAPNSPVVVKPVAVGWFGAIFGGGGEAAAAAAAATAAAAAAASFAAPPPLATAPEPASEPHDVEKEKEKEQRAHAAARVQSFARGRASRSSPRALNKALRDKQQVSDEKQSDPEPLPLRPPSPKLAPPSPLPTANSTASPPPPPCGDVSYDTDEFAETEGGVVPTTTPAPKPKTGAVDEDAQQDAPPTVGKGKGKGKGKGVGAKGKGATGATVHEKTMAGVKTSLDEPD